MYRQETLSADAFIDHVQRVVAVGDATAVFVVAVVAVVVVVAAVTVIVVVAVVGAVTVVHENFIFHLSVLPSIFSLR